jgi:hypothetical protein
MGQVALCEQERKAEGERRHCVSSYYLEVLDTGKIAMRVGL